MAGGFDERACDEKEAEEETEEHINNQVLFYPERELYGDLRDWKRGHGVHIFFLEVSLWSLLEGGNECYCYGNNPNEVERKEVLWTGIR